ncbi:MAG TPA: NlpC/P60 family protein [Candidatus Angelobacter sp.]|nr:NlpC/P60 family protein [Candidatus Angelobacter sp.]
MQRFRTLGTSLLLLIAYGVGGTQIAVAQHNTARTYRLRASANDDVWYFAPPARMARQVVLRLGHQLRRAGLDCSHLVHDIYARAGFPYAYATSTEIYDGVDAFRRTYHPLAGDLIVWRGHVGIVLDPDEHTFLSELRTGVKVSQFDTNYWKKRGQPRFYRYSAEGGSAPDWSQASVEPRGASDDAE